MNLRFLIAFVISCGSTCWAQTFQWTNFAGQPGGVGSADGTGSAARFSSPQGSVLDSSGNLIVADAGNHTIRKVTPAGVVTTIAGKAGICGLLNGTGTAAEFCTPTCVALDSAGNIYVADRDNNVIRKITPAGIVTTLAGSPAGAPGFDDGTGSAATFSAPSGIAVNSSGVIYVADRDNNMIRSITSSGVVSTLAGSPFLSGGADGTGSGARFNLPTGICVDGSGVLYVADTNNSTIRKVTAAGVVTTLAGVAGSNGHTDGTGRSARFFYPEHLTVAPGGIIYVADVNNFGIRKVTSGGTVSTMPGTDGTLDFPEGVSVDSSGTVFVSNSGAFDIRKVTSAGTMTPFVGASPVTGTADGTGNAARFNSPRSVALDSSGNLYIADGSFTVRKSSPSGAVVTLAGNPGVSGTNNGTGSGATFGSPQGIAVDTSGNAYVVDNGAVRKITPAGVVTTFVGTLGTSGSTDASGPAARFNFPRGLAIDSSGNLYVEDTNNHTIRKVTPAGEVTTLAGSPAVSGSADGSGSIARFNLPTSVATDASGNVYVADCANSTIRKVTPAGVVTTLAGSPGLTGTVNGTGGAARFNLPQGIAADSSGTIYVADTDSSTIRKVTAAGVVTTIGGTAFQAGDADGCGVAAAFSFPQGLTVSSAGTIFVADTGNNRISRGSVPAPPAVAQSAVSNLTTTTVTLNGAVNPNGVASTAEFRYGVNASYGTVVSLTLAPNNGSLPQSVNANLAGLTPNTTYHYQLAATNGLGTNATVDATFTTLAGTNANLSAITLSSGTLSPAFLSTATQYNASVANTVASISVTPTVADASATVRVNSNLVTSGSASPPINLSVGANPITVEGRAQNGVTTQTYTLTVTRLSEVQDWRQLYFGTTENSGDAADTFDFDHDGLPNLIEWACGLNPKAASVLPAGLVHTGSSIDFTYTRSVAAVNAGVIYQVQWSDTLPGTNAWSTSGVTETIVSNNGNVQQVKAAVPTAGAVARFVRLSVSAP